MKHARRGIVDTTKSRAHLATLRLTNHARFGMTSDLSTTRDFENSVHWYSWRHAPMYLASAHAMADGAIIDSTDF